VLELDDLEDRAVDVDVVPVAKLIGVDDRRSVLLEPNSNVVAAARVSIAAGSR
jgi:hypothetical protein